MYIFFKKICSYCHFKFVYFPLKQDYGFIHKNFFVYRRILGWTENKLSLLNALYFLNGSIVWEFIVWWSVQQLNMIQW